MLTALRLDELRPLTVLQVDLGGPSPVAVFRVTDEKARRRAEVSPRVDLPADLS